MFNGLKVSTANSWITRWHEIERNFKSFEYVLFGYTGWRQALEISSDQKQPLEVFCKKRCSWKFRKIHRKTTVPESTYNFIKFYNFIYYKSLFEEQKFRTNSLQLSDIIPIGGIITKTFQYAKGESWDIPIGNNHV